MTETLDAPEIRRAERWGAADGEALCPVCGAECADVYLDAWNEIAGCECCLRRVDVWQAAERLQKGKEHA